MNRCDQDRQREHYDAHTGKVIQELFETDREALLPLHCVPFDTALYTSAVIDKYGKFTLDNGKHWYSASPAFCETTCIRQRHRSSGILLRFSASRSLPIRERSSSEPEFAISRMRFPFRITRSGWETGAVFWGDDGSLGSVKETVLWVTGASSWFGPAAAGNDEFREFPKASLRRSLY